MHSSSLYWVITAFFEKRVIFSMYDEQYDEKNHAMIRNTRNTSPHTMD